MSLTLTIKRGGGSTSGSGSDFTLLDTIEGEQISSIEIFGETEQDSTLSKNILNPSDASLSTTASFSGTSGNVFTTSSNNYRDVIVVKVDPNTSYVISANGSSYGDYTQFYIAGLSSPTVEAGEVWGWFTKSGTFTTGSTTTYVGIIIRPRTSGGDITPQTLQLLKDCQLQLEKGTTPTSYEEYFGGYSPVPQHPETVKVASGVQTIVVSDDETLSQTYSLDLGSIELCKIGSFQDRIFKLGENWFVYKEIEKIQAPTSGWSMNTEPVSGNYRRAWYDMGGGLHEPSIILCMSDKFRGVKFDNRNSDFQNTCYSRDTNIGITTDVVTTDSALNTWFANNPTVFYRVLATPTTTQISDAALLAQLEALEGITTYDIATHFVVTGLDTPVSLEVSVDVGGEIEKTYTEVELGSPFTITDEEGKSQNTTLDGNIFVDYAYSKKSFTVDIFHLTPQDYADIRAFYDYQYSNARFPVISIPELDIENMPVYFEMSNRQIVNQCLLTDKLTLKFRETIQP